VLCDEAIVYANPAAERLFDAPSPPGLRGEQVSRLLPGTGEAARLDGSRFAASVQSAPTTFAGRPAMLYIVRNTEHEQALQRRLAHKRSVLLALSGRLIHLQENERRHIARELHDEIGQCLSAIRVQFAKLQRRVKSPEALALIASAASMTESTLGRVRSLSLLLHPPQLDTLGLSAALRWHVEEQRKLHGLEVVLEVGSISEPVQPDLAIAVYRIVQESLSNVLRHARARWVTVALQMQGDVLAVEIRDDGRGFDAAGQRANKHAEPTLGLLSMTERARLVGGVLEVSSTPGQGTRVAASFPTAERRA
jgi:signal transduction histidine kinase